MRERARHAFARFADMIPSDAPDIRLLGTSGTVTTLASVHLALPSYDRQAVDGLHVPVEAMRRISSMIAGMDLAERSALPCIGSERADLVVAGCAILEAILDIWPAETIGRRRPRHSRGDFALADGARRPSVVSRGGSGRGERGSRPRGAARHRRTAGSSGS